LFSPLSNDFERSVLVAIGTQSRQAAGEIKTPPPVREAALFRGSEYMIRVIPGARAPLYPRVMPGLVLGIHVLRAERQGVDGRVKPGHDGKWRERD
jgi:hypothetical protein